MGDQKKDAKTQARLDDLEKDVGSLKSRLSKSLSRLEAFDKHATEQHLDEMQESCRKARDRASVELQKNIVLSEVGRYLARTKPDRFSELYLYLLEDMDRDVDWWANSREWELNEWRDYLIGRAESNAA